VGASPDSGAEHRDAGWGDVIPLSGVRGLAADFDGFIVDQWGVLHDGSKPYPGALDCLEALRAQGKRVVVLTNSGRTAAANARLMERMGFPARLFDRFVCAGEDARDAVAARATPFHARLGRRCYAFTRGGNRSLLEGLGLEFVARVEAAEFLAVLGIDAAERSLADYESELAAGAARGLPMLCANPDLVSVSAGGLVAAPGALARRYEELGGTVFYHGKPWPAIYASCLAALADCAPARLVAIGDSVDHDVLGARRAGLASALVVGGVHAAELGAGWGELPTPAVWRAFAGRAAARPAYLVPTFAW
jgi:HAD superfamily hydrolase (TIGR01459 family)